MLKHYITSLFFSLVFTFLAKGVSPESDVPLPNILVIMSDDAGFADFGFQNPGGNLAKLDLTPNLDRLASEGAIFDQAYVSSSVCGPSRAGFITGRYQERFGFYQNEPAYWTKPPHPDWLTDDWKAFGLPPEEKTMGNYMQELGYHTGIIGKWHLGYDEAHYPTVRGFDYFYGMRGGARDYFPKPWYNETKKIPNNWRSIEENGKIIPEESLSYLTDDFTTAAISFMENPKNLPFFLFVSYTTPHSPMQPDEPSLAKVRKLFPGVSDKRQKALALMVSLDKAVGELLDSLDTLELQKDTMVVFINDNGGSKNNAADNTPLRGHKWSPFEGGLRVPMTVRWPGKIDAGTVIKDPIISLDWLPTFIEAAGATLPAENNLDGISLMPRLTKTEAELPERNFFWKERNSEGNTAVILHSPWKLIISEKSGTHLYNLDDDLAETRNLAPDRPEKVLSLQTSLHAWEEILSPPAWPVN